ncbi:putative multiple sugar transport system substrate-binding protein [Lachnospiraceae bacterium PF1-21]|uniref:Sugar ABC transporter substrate-binding protein n=1 Tax=Ohessyouella blattaphilus TaxID=2949333 RepID=A0ABT1EE80_9FIRM|nr:multiple monosaccharide ABC transporter substrate-binding protein [Ohessyouella blattaphilus]MCP1109012.1 sugar ABC transporter substrate-binding protein [Ohessyouella blattaphilus]MCR8562406.1 sugar ABC transporter substrate-binding protein [Ohessyouella blattaphilus]MDL2249749.1 sugar-binding protein [Lachnospiraceae bacterium OttesenSCG-928-J05]
MKKIFSLLLVAVLAMALFVGCTPKSDSGDGGDDSSGGSGEGKTVGVAMPTQSSERWIKDGDNMKSQLEELGYKVDLQYAEDDPQQQVSQLENMLASGVDCLVVAAIDSQALINPLKQAKDAGVPVVAYDRLLMDTDAVSYYATFDNKGIGTAIGSYVEEKLDLANATETYTFELFMGSPDDNNAYMLYDGLMEVIQPYIDKGTLVCKSGQTSFEKSNTLRWDQQTAMRRCEDILSSYYADEKLDIAFSAYDGLSYGVKAACEGAGYKVGAEDWPVITGQDAELMAVKNIIAGSQTMSIAKDTRILAEKCVKMVEAVLKGTEPEINDTEQYDNGKLVVPSYLCEPQPVDKDNYKEILVDTEYYTEAEINEE